MSEPSEPGPTHTPYGQDPYGPPPTSGQSPYGQQPVHGQYGQPAYGQYGQQPAVDKRPGTVTAAAWITIVSSALVAVLLVLGILGFMVARDEVIAEIESTPEFADAGIDADAALGAVFAFLGFFIVWSIIAIVLAVFVLRRSNVARILLVISAAVVAVLSLLGIASLVSAVPLLAAVAVIVLLFVGGAGDWFRRTPTSAATPAPYGQQYPGPGQYGTGSTTPNPYGEAPAPGQQNPYGQDTQGGDHPPKDYPGR